MKIRTKLTFSFVLISIGSILIVGFFAYYNGRHTIEQQTINHLVSTNLLKSSEMDRWIYDNKISLEALAQRPLVIEYTSLLSTHEVSTPEYRAAYTKLIEDHFNPRLQSTADFTELFVMCPVQGIILASTDEHQEGKHRDTRDYFIEGKARTYVKSVYYSLAMEEPSMIISTPVKDNRGIITAVLAARLNLMELSSIMELRSGVNESEYTYLVNTSNFFVTEPLFGRDYALKVTVHTQGVNAGLAGDDGVGQYPDYRGVPVMGAYKWLPEYEICMITEMDQAEAYAPINRLATTILLVIIALAVIVGFAGYLFSRSIKIPLFKLITGTEEIRKGNLDYKVGTSAKDGIGTLSRAFDDMSANLKTTLVSRDELKQSEERFRIAAESANDLIWDRDIASGRLEWFGDIDGILGYEPYGFPRTVEAWTAAIHPDDRDRVDRSLEQHFTRGTDYREEYRIRRKDGSYLYWIDRGTAVKNGKGKPQRMFGACSDITERKHYEEKLRETLAEVERSNTELEHFAYVASHDLQEPLRMVSSYTQLLERRYKDRLDSDASEFIAYAVDGAKRMQRLINDLLSYSRIGTRGQPFQPASLQASLDDALANLKISIEESGAVISHDPLPTVDVDEGQMVQLFQNLLDNAIKFRGDHAPRIHIFARHTEEEWTIAVEDNGIGIEPQYFERIFIVFQRLYRQEYRGTGIGLALVKRIVERHGGRIWLESSPGSGSTFYFTIPVKRKMEDS